MVLALLLVDVYRESILGFALKRALAGERIVLVSPNSRVNLFSVFPAFAPAGEVLLFRQKDLKPVTPRPALLEADGRRLAEGGPTRSAQTRPASS
jgi:hypothetical protein